MTKLSLTKDINARAQKKFPDFEVTFDGVEGEEVEITFRNIVRLSKAERKLYNTAASTLQGDLLKEMERAKKAVEEEDVETLRELDDIDSTDLMVELLRKQLGILAKEEDASKHLATLTSDQVLTLHSIVVEGGAAEGEASSSPNS